MWPPSWWPTNSRFKFTYIMCDFRLFQVYFASLPKIGCPKVRVRIRILLQCSRNEKSPVERRNPMLPPRKAMILLSLLGKREDKFWFSFFHEAGHIINDSKKDMLINDGTQDDPREKRANDFASEFLIPSRFNTEIQQFRSKAEVINLAGELNISPGIVAGRYQLLTGKWNFFKELDFEDAPHIYSSQCLLLMIYGCYATKIENRCSRSTPSHQARGDAHRIVKIPC